MSVLISVPIARAISQYSNLNHACVQSHSFQFGNEAEIQYIYVSFWQIAFLGDFQAKGNNLLIEILDIICTTNYHTLIFRYFQSILSVCLFRLYFLNRWSKEH